MRPKGLRKPWRLQPGDPSPVPDAGRKSDPGYRALEPRPPHYDGMRSLAAGALASASNAREILEIGQWNFQPSALPLQGCTVPQQNSPFVFLSVPSRDMCRTTQNVVPMSRLFCITPVRLLSRSIRTLDFSHALSGINA